MGYSTDFTGSFRIDPPLDDETYTFLINLDKTRRMARHIDGYGVEGEFYVGDDEDNVIDYNSPPITQPSLWCQWIPTDKRDQLKWNGGEKFYNYVQWLFYIIHIILEPRNYVVNGNVKYQGDRDDDNGVIQVDDNKITISSKNDIKSKNLFGYTINFDEKTIDIHGFIEPTSDNITDIISNWAIIWIENTLMRRDIRRMMNNILNDPLSTIEILDVDRSAFIESFTNEKKFNNIVYDFENKIYFTSMNSWFVRVKFKDSSLFPRKEKKD